MPGDETTQRVHEDMLLQNRADIQDIKKDLVVIATLQEKFSNMEGWLKSISTDIKNFIEKTDDKFQTKEMCDVCMQTSEKQYAELVKIYENRVTDLKETYSRAISELKSEYQREIKELKDEHKNEAKETRNKLWGALLLALSAIATVAWTLTKTHIIEVVK